MKVKILGKWETVESWGKNVNLTNGKTVEFTDIQEIRTEKDYAKQMGIPQIPKNVETKTENKSQEIPKNVITVSQVPVIIKQETVTVKEK